MRIISKARLKRFWESPDRGDSEGPLRAWHTHVSKKSVAWRSWGDIRRGFAAASVIGSCVVFNIGGNKYRLATRVLPLTQDCLAIMLGVQRTTVSAAASQLRDEGLIRYSRGQLEIVDRPGLEARACECYEALKRLQTRLLAPPAG